MKPTGNLAGKYEVHSDGTNICLYCNLHGEFGHCQPKYWKLDRINASIVEHEKDYHQED